MISFIRLFMMCLHTVKGLFTRKDNNYNSTDNYKAAYQSPLHLKDLEHLKRQRTEFQHMLRINRTLSSTDVNSKIVILIVIILGLNRP